MKSGEPPPPLPDEAPPPLELLEEDELDELPPLAPELLLLDELLLLAPELLLEELELLPEDELLEEEISPVDICTGVF